MRIEFTHNRSPAYFRSQLSKAAWHAVRRILLAALALAVAGAMAVVGSQGEGLATVAGSLAVVIAILLPLRAWRVYSAMVTVPPDWCGHHAWVITEDGLESRSDLTLSRWSWRVVRRVDTTPTAYLLWQDGPTVFDVPREPMTADQDGYFRVTLAERGLLNPQLDHSTESPPRTD